MLAACSLESSNQLGGSASRNSLATSTIALAMISRGEALGFGASIDHHVICSLSAARLFFSWIKCTSSAPLDRIQAESRVDHDGAYSERAAAIFDDRDRVLLRDLGSSARSCDALASTSGAPPPCGRIASHGVVSRLTTTSSPSARRRASACASDRAQRAQRAFISRSLRSASLPP